MAYRLAMDKSYSINHLRSLGYSQRRIARTLSVSRGAVRRHLTVLAPNSTTALDPGEQAADEIGASNSTTLEGSSEATPPPGSASSCEPFRDQILAKLDQGLSVKRIHQDLVDDHEFSHKSWAVYRFVKTLGVKTELPFRRLETLPGVELQVDFGTGAKIRLADGRYRKTHVFRAVLSHSRKGYSEAVYRQTTENFITALENAFWSLGGVPERVVFDNAKCAVIQADWYDPELHPKIIDFCKHYGFAFIPTRPRTPRHKGKVERGVDYVQENALRGHEFESLADQNSHLDHWERTIADERIHGTTQDHVGTVFHNVERAALKSLPLERFPFYHEARRKVTRDGHIAVNKAFYSVLPEYLGRSVWVRHNSRLVRILNERMELIATHTTKQPGRFSTLDAHIASAKINSVERGVAYLLKKTHFLGSSATRWAEAVIENRGVEAAKVLQGLLSLSKKHSSESIDAACDTAWRSGALNYRVIKRLLSDRAAASQQTMEFMDTHPIIRPVSEYADFIHQSFQGR
ncbi:IS21 family transposase [Novipirellula artificiosorum]|nr:IS21 family transposase [Novipirellula artificiosorum]